MALARSLLELGTMRQASTHSRLQSSPSNPALRSTGFHIPPSLSPDTKVLCAKPCPPLDLYLTKRRSLHPLASGCIPACSSLREGKPRQGRGEGRAGPAVAISGAMCSDDDRAHFTLWSIHRLPNIAPKYRPKMHAFDGLESGSGFPLGRISPRSAMWRARWLSMTL